MKTILTFLFFFIPALAFAESNTNGVADENVEVVEQESEFDLAVDAISDSFDWDFFDGKGWTPRYAWVSDDSILGNMHYMGVSYYTKEGANSEGPTLRFGLGEDGEKINLAYTSTFSFMHVDMGLSYVFPDSSNDTQLEEEVEGIGLELGLRLWVVQIIGIHMEETSYISLAYGF